MKFRSIAAVSVAAAAMTLVACAPDPIDEGASASPSSSASPTVEAAVTPVEPDIFFASAEWTDNGEGAAPEYAFAAPVDFTATGATLIADGDGATISEGQVLAINYVAYNGADGSVLYSTYDGDGPEFVQLSAAQFDEGLMKALVGSKIGADVVFVIPDQGSGATIMAMTISDAVDTLDRAEGTAVAPVDGLPVVTLAENGAPTVTFADETMPTELVAQDLITGTGAVVSEGQNLLVHYSGWVWGSDTTFDSSWDRDYPTSFSFVTGGLIQGWIDGLSGKTVGSQVLLVVPPDLGYGDTEQGDIPAGSTLVFVVDILAAY